MEQVIATVPPSAQEPAGTAAPQRAAAQSRSRGLIGLLLILVAAGAAIMGAMRHTSPTFDEIVFVAGGARGLQSGLFDLAPDHPPLMQYIYGLPGRLRGFVLPDESAVTPELRASGTYRYLYSAAYYFGVGNDPEQVSFAGRLPAVLMALLLVVLVFAFVRRHWGDGAALLAAALTAFLPDVLAHGGIAYSDVPVTLAIFAAAWAADHALRVPTLRSAAAAGALAGLAVCVKISAAILLPLAVLLATLEGLRRAVRPAIGEPALRDWIGRIAVAALVATAAAYLVLALVYRGDFMLAEFRYGLAFRFRHMTGGHGATAFLLGDTSVTGWWYFFPVAFLFKTSAGLHLLLLISVAALAWRFARDPLRALATPLRWPLATLVLFGGTLLTSSLNIGFRYAMPVLPLLCVVAAAGAAHAWPPASRLVRGSMLAAAVWAPLFALSWYPHFIPFISEYGPGRDDGHEVLVDSSLDWGQGLIALRNYMRDHDIASVYLSYFGSAWPAGYGIRYQPLPSFFPLPAAPDGVQPEHVVIAATNLRGTYFNGDPFAHYREIRPDTVLAHTLFVYRLHREGD